MGTVLPDCLLKEGQGDLHPQDRRNLPSILLTALRVPQHRNSNRGDMAGNHPERGNERDKEGGSKRKRERQRERACEKMNYRKCLSCNIDLGLDIDWLSQ